MVLNGSSYVILKIIQYCIALKLRHAVERMYRRALNGLSNLRRKDLRYGIEWCEPCYLKDYTICHRTV